MCGPLGCWIDPSGDELCAVCMCALAPRTRICMIILAYAAHVRPARSFANFAWLASSLERTQIEDGKFTRSEISPSLRTFALAVQS
jgi:hypothetical protein|eukprot:COSAG01_NODE_854_length_13095_cov_57.207525_4_plen_86_part_00